MNDSQSFADRLWHQIMPSLGQALLMLALGIGSIVVTQSQTILTKLGISQAGIVSTQTSLSGRTHDVLISPFTANLALIVFWSTIGLVAYLVCWGVYNMILELRNEVTLAAGYTNRGHWQGAPQTFALKLVCGIGLVATLLSLKYGFSLWLGLSSGALSDRLSVASIIELIVAIVGVAAELYLVLMFIQLTFTKWYSPNAFTDE